MALRKVNKNWIGLSSDAKPTTGVQAHTYFNETDTGKLFIYVHKEVDNTDTMVWKQITIS